jgi:hypothetical protein
MGLLRFEDRNKLIAFASPFNARNTRKRPLQKHLVARGR